MSKDPELTRLLVLELERHKLAMEGAEEIDTIRRSVHALKGSAGLAGEMDLSSAFQRIERRFREGDDTATADTIELVTIAIRRLSAGEGAVEKDWPAPPRDLRPMPLDPEMRAEYTSECADRLAKIDEALASRGDPVELATTIYRHVHTIKGAASAVGDEPMSWFCHGLEEKLKHAQRSRDEALAAMSITAELRAVLGGLLDDPDAALEALRSAAGHRGEGRSSFVPSTRPEEDSRVDDATVRVAASSIDEVLDGLAAISVVRERVAARINGSRSEARTLRKLRADLTDALRLIGPPRPWGAPAAALRRIERAAASISELAEELDHVTQSMRQSATMLRDADVSAKRHLSSMRQTPLRGVFQRITASVEIEARRAGKLVEVRTRGGEEAIDRRLAEQLVEPLLQLGRNAVAHGIEDTQTRRAMNKRETALVNVFAHKAGHRLSVSIADDGAGVDARELRARAVDAGALTETIANAADDNTILALLFLPGFSTRANADLLAGRGIGLDLALASIQKLGGSIRLSSRRGEGFEARVDVPLEAGLADVLWVTAADTEYALFATATRSVRAGADAKESPHLVECLEPQSERRANARYVIDLDAGVEGSEPVALGIDGVGGTEEVLVRPLSPLAAGLGPFAGAIVRGDGSLRLVLDGYALSTRARALGHARSA